MRTVRISTISIPLLAALVSSCVTTPQTRNELKTTVSEHTTLGIAETHVAHRDLDSVARTLAEKWQECYAVTTTTSRGRGGITTMRIQDTLHPKFRRVNASLIEGTIQVTTTGATSLNKVPDGGDYAVALDLVRLPGHRTLLKWYSARWGWTAGWKANQDWSDGKDVPCPN